jgi:uncharacterized protein (DUF58 family)
MADTIILEQKPAVAGSTAASSTAKRQRLYIFPTQHGLVYACMLAVMLLGAVNYTNNMAYMLTFLLASLFLVCMLHTYRNLRGLIVSCSDAKPVFAGEVAQFPVLFDNRAGRLRSSVAIQRWPKVWLRRKNKDQGIPSLSLEPSSLSRDFLPVPTTSRGYLRAGRLRISSCWPLGLFRAWSYLDSQSSCIVYPMPQGDPRLPYLSEDASLDQTGDLAGTDDFTGFRHYHPGDSIRNIDWKVLAREQGLLVKKFSGSGAKQLILHWDQTAHLADVEARLSQLSLWLIRAEQAGLRYGLNMPDARIEIDHGDNHQHRCLSLLATYGQHTVRQV